MGKIRSLINAFLSGEDASSLVYLQILIGILFSLWSIVIFSYITNAVTQTQTLYIDEHILQFVTGLRSDWLTPVMFVFSLLGSEAIIVGSILVLIYLSLKKHRRETFIFSIILFMGLMATVFLKLSYEIPRPSFVLPLDVENSFSYPSGHALNSLLFYSTLSYFVLHLTKSVAKTVLSFTVTGILIFFIGFSRIYLGAHYPSDVVAGWISGLWLFVTTMLIDKTIVYFRLMRETPNL